VRELIASPFLGEYLLLRRGSPRGLKISHQKYLQVARAATAGDLPPEWLVGATRSCWDLDIGGQPTGKTILVRARSP
jgi:hypothetical protein